jgi:hypothetical protein
LLAVSSFNLLRLAKILDFWASGVMRFRTVSHCDRSSCPPRFNLLTGQRSRGQSFSIFGFLLLTVISRDRDHFCSTAPEIPLCDIVGDRKRFSFRTPSRHWDGVVLRSAGLPAKSLSNLGRRSD